MERKCVAAFVLCVVLALGVFAAEIKVSRLEVATRGAPVNDTFSLSTIAEADIEINGGYKYGILLGLGFETANLEKAFSYGKIDVIPPGQTVTRDRYNDLADRFNNQATLSVRRVEAIARDAFGYPIDLSFFAGRYHSLGSGEDFEAPGSSRIRTAYRGFFYFPELDRERRYDGGIHTITGTGFAAKLKKWDPFFLNLYLYQDLSYHRDLYPDKPLEGFYTADVRLQYATPRFKTEFFAGLSYPHPAPAFHTGILAFMSPAAIIDLLFQAGISYAGTGVVSAENLYFLLEPRVKFEGAGLDLTFFYRPLYYQNIANMDERGKLSFNVRLYFGALRPGDFEWGLETTISLHQDEGQLAGGDMWFSPFIGVRTDGLQWDFKVRINPLFFTRTGEQFGEIFAGIRGVY